ncbi:hypothetical protein D3C81_1454480 [compost metagenome]
MALEQRRGGGFQPELADLRPGFVELGRVRLHVERRHACRLGAKCAEMPIGLAVGGVEGRPEGGIAEQQPVGGAPAHLRLAHEVERAANQRQAAQFILRGADRLHRLVQHGNQRAAERNQEQDGQQHQLARDRQTRHQVHCGGEESGHGAPCYRELISRCIGLDSKE